MFSKHFSSSSLAIVVDIGNKLTKADRHPVLKKEYGILSYVMFKPVIAETMKYSTA